MTTESWLPVSPKSPFSLANIPFGIITTPSSEAPHNAIAIGDYALDLASFASCNGFFALPSIHPHLSIFSHSNLNAYAALPIHLRRSVRQYLQEVLADKTPTPQALKQNTELQKQCLFPLSSIRNHLHMQIGDYTDFYAGANHARTCAALFNISQHPNYDHLPIAYHSRASSVVISGTPIRRPWGQILENPAAEPKVPSFAPCRLLDYELELGAFVSKENQMGQPVGMSVAEESIFGLVLMNDWSARDVQMWEYVPLGPFNSKNLGTSISPWIVTVEALEPFLVEGLRNYSQVQRYLVGKEKGVYDMTLEVDITCGYIRDDFTNHIH